MSDLEPQPPAGAPQPAGESGESKEQKFVRLATKRTQAALSKIRLLTNLSASSYRYTPEQADRIVAALREAVDEVDAKFKKIKREGGPAQPFSL